jgi:DNA-3-methyladenine glycosylase II
MTPDKLSFSAPQHRPEYWSDATIHLIEQDEILARIIGQYSGEMLQSRGHAFHTLARSIVGQQISVKAADTVWARFSAMLQHQIHPLPILDAAEEELRACGLSRAKVLYMKALAEHFHTQDIHAEGYWHAKTDDEIVRELSTIKGIGVWSAEMFLIFHLMRPDVFPLGDIGLLNAIEKHYGVPAKDKKAMRALSERWRPYRTVATWYFWRSLDPVPVEY